METRESLTVNVGLMILEMNYQHKRSEDITCRTRKVDASDLLLMVNNSLVLLWQEVDESDRERGEQKGI